MGRPSSIKNAITYQAGYKAGYEASQHDGRKQGRWILKGHEWYCSECGTLNEQTHQEFCAKCGAEMDRDKVEVIRII